MTDTNEPGDIIDFILTEARDGKVDVNIFSFTFYFQLILMFHLSEIDKRRRSKYQQ